MILSATGHRPQKIGNEFDLVGPYSDYIKEEFRKIILERKPDKCISGMALGVDQLFSLVAIELQVPVIAAVPFKGQESIWPQKSKDLYNEILSNPLVEEYVVYKGGYQPWKMLKRNCWMVDNSDVVAAVWDNCKGGGTYHCVEYARSKDKEIIYIDPEGWRPRTKDLTLF